MPKQTLVYSDYKSVRGNMRPGDIIAFSGTGFPSNEIERVTGSPISHVGTILQTKVLVNGKPQVGNINSIIEATSLDGKCGVQINRLSERLATYNGAVFWLPLSLTHRKNADWARFYNFLLRQDHKGYNFALIARLAGVELLNALKLPSLGKYFSKFDDYKKAGHFICSELVAAGLEEAGYLPARDAEMTTPADLVSMQIYRSQYHRLVTKEQPAFKEVVIGNFNSKPVQGFVLNPANEAAAEKTETPVIVEPAQSEQAA